MVPRCKSRGTTGYPYLWVSIYRYDYRLPLRPRTYSGPTRQAFQNAPLAERRRPRTLAEYAGQQHLVGPEGVLRRYLSRGALAVPYSVGPARRGQNYPGPPDGR